MFLIFLIIVCCYCCTTTNGQGAANFVLEKHYYCENMSNQKINLSVVPKTFNPTRQIMDVTLITPISIGNELKFAVKTEIEITLINKSHWQYLFSVEDGFCRIIQIYLGEMMYQLETAWGIPRGACPIARGRYHTVNYTPDWSRLKLQTFPFGKLRITLQILDNPARNILHCSVFIVSNTA